MRVSKLTNVGKYVHIHVCVYVNVCANTFKNQVQNTCANQTETTLLRSSNLLIRHDKPLLTQTHSWDTHVSCASWLFLLLTIHQFNSFSLSLTKHTHTHTSACGACCNTANVNVANWCRLSLAAEIIIHECDRRTRCWRPYGGDPQSPQEVCTLTITTITAAAM